MQNSCLKYKYNFNFTLFHYRLNSCSEMYKKMWYFNYAFPTGSLMVLVFIFTRHVTFPHTTKTHILILKKIQYDRHNMSKNLFYRPSLLVFNNKQSDELLLTYDHTKNTLTKTFKTLYVKNKSNLMNRYWDITIYKT